MDLLASYLWAADRHELLAERYERQGQTAGAARERDLAKLNRQRAKRLTEEPPATRPS